MLHFLHPESLILLVLVPLILLAFGYLIRWKKKVIGKIGDADLVTEQLKDYAPKKFKAKFILFLTAFTLCIVALTGMISADPSQKIVKSGKDIIIALDVSRSMMANDVQPDRLERAKQLISKVIDQFPDARIGLVIFAGRAYLQMPLTVDHEAAKMYTSIASPDDVPTQGTNLAGALQMSLASFDMTSKSYKSILLISDGEDHEPDATKAAESIAKQGIMINTVGIGSPSGATIPDEMSGGQLTDKEGRVVVSRLNEKMLEDIARAAHGEYQLYTNPDKVVTQLANQMNKLNQVPSFTESSYLSFQQYYWYFLVAAFVLLLIEMAMSDKKRKLAKALPVVLLLLMGSSSSYGQSTVKLIWDGNQAFRSNQFDAAEKEYQSALEKESKYKDIAAFNLGNVYYRKNETDKAVKAFDQVIQSDATPAIKQQAFYNKGVVLQKSDKLPECITAYKNALLLNPNDEDARQNLQRAIKKQEQQQQQQPQQQNNKNNENKNNTNNPQQPRNQPPKSPSKLSQQQAEDKLKALEENERALQEKMRKVKGVSPDTPDKNW